MDHLGEPVDLDLNADGKTDDQTVQLRPKAPSKPPRTFVSTDLDPNYRVDHRGYQEEIDVPESEGIEAADQKSESSAHAINLQDDGHDERVLSPHAKKPVKKKQKKKNKQNKSRKQGAAEEHVYAVIDKKKKRRKNSANEIKENIYEEIGVKVKKDPPPLPPPLLKHLSIIGDPEPSCLDNPKESQEEVQTEIELSLDEKSDTVQLEDPVVRQAIPKGEPNEAKTSFDEKNSNDTKSRKKVKKLDPMLILQSSTREHEEMPEVLKPLPEVKHESELSKDSAMVTIETEQASEKESSQKSKADEVKPEELPTEKPSKPKRLSLNNVTRSKSEEIPEKEPEKYSGSLQEVHSEKANNMNPLARKSKKPNDKVRETAIIAPEEVLKPVAQEEINAYEPKITTEIVAKDLEPQSTESELFLDSGISLDEVRLGSNEQVSSENTSEDKSKVENESKSLDIPEENQSLPVSEVQSRMMKENLLESAMLRNPLARKSKKEVEPIEDNTKLLDKKASKNDLTVPAPNEPELENVKTEKENPVIQTEEGSGNGTSSNSNVNEIETSSLNPLARKSKSKVSASEIVPKDNLPIFRMAPASTAAKVPGTRTASATAATTKDKRLSREPSLNFEPDKNHDEDNDNDDDDDLDLTLFSKYLPKAKKKTTTMKKDKLPKGLTQAEEQALNEAQKAKEAEALQAQKMEEERLVKQKEARLRRKAEEEARLAKTRQLQIEKDLKAQAKKVSDNAPRPTTEDLRAQLKLMANQSDFRQKRVDDLQIDEDDDLLPRSKPGHRTSSTSSSDSEAEIGLVTESTNINKGMCLLAFKSYGRVASWYEDLFFLLAI